jgi:uncharacterized protein involved in outer membrane biogenesis
MRIWPKKRTWRIPLWVGLVFIAYSIGPYFGVPPLIRYFARNQGSAALNRQVTVGQVNFNPYNLRLVVNDLRVGERGGHGVLAKIGRLNLGLSWTSLYHLAAVVNDVIVERPTFHLIRTAPQSFNVSDLLQPRRSPAPHEPSKPRHFAISNIQLTDGEILLHDQVLNHEHRVSKIRLQIPFIANLPTHVDTYVEPLLQMTVDGRPFAIAGKMKPFGSTRESVINLGVHRLDLTQYTDYAPVKLPVKLTSAILSTAVQVAFIQLRQKPEIQIDGTASLDGVVLRDAANAPLVEMKALRVAMADVEPLDSLIHLSSIKIESLRPHLQLNRDGTTNLTPLLRPQRPSPAVKVSPSQNVSAEASLPEHAMQTPGATSSTVASPSQGATERTSPTSQAMPFGGPQIVRR